MHGAGPRDTSRFNPLRRDPVTDLASLLVRLAARYHKVDGLWRFSRTAWLGPLAAALVLAVARILPLAGDRIWAVGLAAVVLVALGLRAWRRRLDPLAAAIRTDRALGLKDRLATAWLLEAEAEQAGSGPVDGAGRSDRAVAPNPVVPISIGGDAPLPNPGSARGAPRRDLVARQRADALAAARDVDPRWLAPLLWARRPLFAFALLSAGALLLVLLPNPRHAELARRAAVKATARTLAAEIRRLEAALVDPAQRPEAGRQEAGAALGALAERLDASRGRAESDLAALAEAETTLRQGLDADALRAAAEARGLAERLSALAREARRPVGEATAGTADTSAARLAEDLRRLMASAADDDQAARHALAAALGDEARSAALDLPEAARQLEAAAEALRLGDRAAARSAAAALGESLGAAEAAAGEARTIEDTLAAVRAGRSAIAQANAAGQAVDSAAMTGVGQPADAGGGAATAQGRQARGGAEGGGGSPDASAGRQEQAADAPGAGAQPSEGGSRPGEGAAQSGQGGDQPGASESRPGQGSDQPGQPGQTASRPGADIAQGQGQTASPVTDATAEQGGGDGGSGDGFSRSGQASGLVYAPPQRFATEGERSFVPGRIAGDQSAGRASERPARQPGLSPSARVPYQQVFPAYRDAAGRALARETIPPARRDYVRAYFAQLEE